MKAGAANWFHNALYEDVAKVEGLRSRSGYEGGVGCCGSFLTQFRKGGF